MKKYPIVFYGRTWMVWAGTLIFGHLVVFGCIMGPLFWLNMIKPANGHPGYEAGIPLTIISLLLLPIAIACAFQVFALQWPILKIYKEGLWIRSIGTRSQSNPALIGTGIDMILILLIILWHLITLQMFRTQIICWRWEDFDLLIKYGTFSIVGWFDQESNGGFEQQVPVPHTVFYGGDSFEMSIDIVREAIQYYSGNPDLRENLPSWQNDEDLK